MFSFKVFIGLLCLGVALGLSIKNDGRRAPPCDEDICALPDCRCASTDIPGGLMRNETPQFVFLTFDDAVTNLNMEYYREALYDIDNPDGCPVSGTFFISHEYTYYDKVHELYKNGQEIALHSISHESSTDYWRELSVEDLGLEFGDQKQLMSHFANIPIEDIKGIRVPLLQLSGDNSYQMMVERDLTYDCSWPTQENLAPGLWPYTLDYVSTQDCPIGPCPIESAPGRWVFPMIMWDDIRGYHCSMTDACPYQPDTEDEHFDWMVENFQRTYETNKAPWGFYVHAAWFTGKPLRFEAYKRFVNYLNNLDDVYIVGLSTALKWVQNPVPLSEMTTSDWSECRMRDDIDCKSQTCDTMKGEEHRYVSVCTSCPRVYPWLNNPLGE